MQLSSRAQNLAIQTRFIEVLLQRFKVYVKLLFMFVIQACNNCLVRCRWSQNVLGIGQYKIMGVSSARISLVQLPANSPDNHYADRDRLTLGLMWK